MIVFLSVEKAFATIESHICVLRECFCGILTFFFSVGWFTVMENSVDHENIFTTLHQMPLYMFCWKIQTIQMSICFDCEFLCPSLQKMPI